MNHARKTRRAAIWPAASLSLLILAPLTACGPAVRIPEGMSAIRVSVVAEPRHDARTYSRSDDAYAVNVPQSYVYERVDYKQVDNVVVWLEPLDKGALDAAAPSADLTLNEQTLKSPQLLCTGTGGTLIVHNATDASHLLYSVSPDFTWNLGTVAPGGIVRRRIESAGEFDLLSRTRRDPLAHVIVAPSPLVAKVSSGTPVLWNAIPPGRYRVGCWHARLPTAGQEVTLQAGRLSDANVRVSVNVLPEAQ